MAPVFAATAVRQHCTGKGRQAVRVIEFTLGEQRRIDVTQEPWNLVPLRPLSVVPSDKVRES
jgi:hypothetical protein